MLHWIGLSDTEFIIIELGIIIGMLWDILKETKYILRNMK
jgi:hypothetical protein